eukprot:TRINITY_DN73325_c0_g1_i1.p1 TRINITY_DN73325_c0_g1~~TRINITY_DN73325_c0_g1_i1.p1  ORF type:complete len:679 (+),score=110.65 TRINITY_DN73325_c0_g1_i1:43-2079(+)
MARQVQKGELLTRVFSRTRRIALLSTVVLLLAVRRFGAQLLRRLLCSLLGLAAVQPGAIRRLGGLWVPGGSPGVQLSTVIFAREGGPAPTLLIRTPYGKVIKEWLAYAVAAQGFNVVLQDCRGRYSSSGAQTFAAFEDLDGRATMAWLAAQEFEWFDPTRVVAFGISYLGIVQWATVAGIERQRQVKQGVHIPQLAAIAPLFASSTVHTTFFQGGAFSLDFYLRYVQFMTTMRGCADWPSFLPGIVQFERRLARHLRKVLGATELHQKVGVPKFFKYNPRPQSKFWKNRDYSDALSCSPPAFIATGWWDLFLEGSLRDYEAVVRSQGPGHSRLVVGNWHHLSSIGPWTFCMLLQMSLDFLKQRTGLAAKDAAVSPKPVRLWIMGARAAQGEWRDFSAWPPEEAEDQLLLLCQGTLRRADEGDEHPASCSVGVEDNTRPSRFTYNPLDPTPSLGGDLFIPWEAGEKEQTPLARRSDVLNFDSEPLEVDSVMVGRARARLFVKASRPHFDIFVHLCDVHPSGQSYNVCTSVMRVRTPFDRAQSHQEVPTAAPGQSSSERVEVVELVSTGTAKRFLAGHRVRLTIACAAFPRYARHFGDAEQAFEHEPVEVQPCTVEVLHSEQEPSALWLPLLPADMESETPRRRRTLQEAAAAWPASPRRRVPMQGFAGMRKTWSEAGLR